MNLRTSLFLVVLLGVVAFFVFREDPETSVVEGGAPTRLFDGLEANDVVRLRLEHVERGLQLTLEQRDGRWWIVDPVEHPADRGVVDFLKSVVQHNLIVPLTDESATAADLGFEPPQAVIEVTTRSQDGEEREQRVELGLADFDQTHVYVRKDGEMGRTVRNLLNTMMRNLDEFRSQRAIQLDAGRVVELHRTGYEQPGIGFDRIDLTLSAFRDGPRWVATAPLNAALDPRVMDALCGAATFLPIRRFVVDVPDDAEPFGLDQPWWRVALNTYGGEEHALLFARPAVDHGSWFMQREGQTAIMEVLGTSLDPLMQPFDALLDTRVLQFPKSDVRELEYEGTGGRYRLRLGQEGWKIQDHAGDDWGDAAIADATLVADFLDRLTQTTLRAPRWGDDAPTLDARGRLVIATTEDRVALSLGADPFLVQREGEDVVFEGEPWLVDRLEAPTATWRSLQLLSVDEVRVQALELSREGVTKRWERSLDHGIWTRAGSDEEDRDVLKVMDGLLFLRGKGALPPGTGPLARPIDGRFVMDDGTEVAFRVGLAQDDRGVLREAGEAGELRALLAYQGLHPRLAGLLAD